MLAACSLAPLATAAAVRIARRKREPDSLGFAASEYLADAKTLWNCWILQILGAKMHR